MNDAKKNKLEYKSYKNGNECAIQNLSAQCFTKEISNKTWMWRFKNNPHGEAIIELAWDDRILAGHYAISKCKLQICGEEFLSGLSGTTMTHPSYRGLGLFSKLATNTYFKMVEKKMIAVWGFPNAYSHRGFVKELKWVDICEIPTFRLMVSGINHQNVDTTNIYDFNIHNVDERFDLFWNKIKQKHKIIVKRNALHIKWRYFLNPDANYRMIACCNQNEILGYAIYKIFENEIQIVDVLILSSIEVGKQLVQRIINDALENKFVAVALWLNMADPLHHVLEQMGFRNDGPVTYFGGLVFGSEGRAVFFDYRNWYITMGDSDVY